MKRKTKVYSASRSYRVGAHKNARKQNFAMLRHTRPSDADSSLQIPPFIKDCICTIHLENFALRRLWKKEHSRKTLSRVCV